MSTTIDERVVEMRFDNKQFEEGISTSMESINKLNRSLKLEGATDGLEKVQTAAKSINFSPVSDSLSVISVKVSALDVMVVETFKRMANTAIDAGKKMVSAFTIDPVKTGFEEYETQINAVQTILANTSSKGTTLDQVNAALDELNTYADMTIYNFTEMTRNIGTFTAAGVDLDTSVAAIKGIANLAAVSGSTSQQASTAMYQLSQALSSGTVKLQDWNSVVNAGMGGQVFQDALKETARVHGVEIDQMIADEGSFRETLKDGWLTSAVLTETLSKFTGDLNEEQLRAMGYADEQIAAIIKMGETANDAATKVKTFTQLFDTLKEAAQSGWTSSWEIIVGDFEEAKKLLTEISDTFGAIIGASSDARNKILSDWKQLGGRTALIDSFRNIFEGIMQLVQPFKEAMSEIFPPLTGRRLAELTRMFRELTNKFKMSEETLGKLKTIFKGFFSVLDIGVQIVKAIGTGVSSLVKYFAPASGSLLDLIVKFSEWLIKLDESVKKSKIFNTIVSELVDAFEKLYERIKNTVLQVKELIKALASHFGFENIFSLSSVLDTIDEKLLSIGVDTKAIKSTITKVLKDLWNNFKDGTIFDYLSEKLLAIGVDVGPVRDRVRKAFNDLGQGIKDGTFLEVLKDIGSKIAEFGKINFDKIKDAFIELKENISTNGLSMADSLKIFIDRMIELGTTNFDALKEKFTNLKDSIVESITSMADGCSSFKTKIDEFLGKLGIAGSLEELVGRLHGDLSIGNILTVGFGASLVLFIRKLGGFLDTVGGATTTIVGTVGAISTGLGKLATDFLNVIKEPITALSNALTGLGGMFLGVKNVLNGFAAQMKTKALINVAIAIGILVVALIALTFVDPEKLKTAGIALASIAGGVVVLFAATSAISKLGGGAGSALSIMSLAVSIGILIAALYAVDALDTDHLGRDFGILAGLAVGLATVAGVLGKACPKLSAGSLTFIAIAAAMKILVDVLVDIDNMELGNTEKTIGIFMALILGLSAVAIASKGVKIGSAVGILAIVAGLKLLVSSIDDIGKLDTSGIKKNLTVVMEVFAMFGALMLVAKLPGGKMRLVPD